MTLMRVQIDKRTIAGFASGGTVTFPHGLVGAPDAVLIRFVATLGSTTAQINITAPVDATNVTLQNCGDAACGDVEVCSLRFHSIIQ